jgi:hypothetical protein
MNLDGSPIPFQVMFDDFQLDLEQAGDDKVHSNVCRTHRSAVHQHCRKIHRIRHNGVLALEISFAVFH